MYDAAPTSGQLDALSTLFARGSVAVLTGAGLSTESGIPDYRGPLAARRARKPIQYQEFLKSAPARQRYWARSMFGWPRFAAARPNAGHTVLRELEAAGLLSGIITQNVDGLHAAAGSERALELHGALRETICLECGLLIERSELQLELERHNRALVALVAERAPLSPDGDAELDDERIAAFAPVDCACGGRLKPNVVFFGENVPRLRVQSAFAIVERARALVVIGSSLTVWSGLRFVRAAAERALPIAIVTLGPTRADRLAELRISAGAGVTLSALRAAMGATPAAAAPGSARSSDPARSE